MAAEETMIELPALEPSPLPPIIPTGRPSIVETTEDVTYILQNQFGPEAAISSDVRARSSVIFQDLVPEQQTTKAEASKCSLSV
ncbi:hypothetical protein FALCPG4_015144 [Fusarium falciforme]